MNFLEYKELAARTCYTIGQKLDDGTEYTEKKHFAHMIGGIITEFGEFTDIFKKKLAYGQAYIDKLASQGHTVESKMYDEYGDWGWYIRNVFYSEEPHEIDTSRFEMEFGEMKNFPDEDIILRLDSVLAAFTSNEFLVYYIWRWIGFQLGIDYEKALDLNIEKLKIRFPEKFDPAQAANKDIVIENKVFNQ